VFHARQVKRIGVGAFIETFILPTCDCLYELLTDREFPLGDQHTLIHRNLPFCVFQNTMLICEFLLQTATIVDWCFSMQHTVAHLV